MNFSTAAAIAKQHAPNLTIDPFNPALPNALIVRPSPTGSPFSIHLPHTLPGTFQDIPAMDAIAEQPAVEASDDHPGHPAIPAQPAQPARTIAGQEAEAEKRSLLISLDAALKQFS